MNHDKAAEKAMIKARIHMLKHEPFFGVLALRLPLVEREDLNPPTLATDGEALYYHPHWVHSNNQETRKSGVAHEVGHCIFNHPARVGERDPGRWSRAGDYVINALLKDSGFVFPNTWLYNPKYAGMSADAVYNLLPPDDGSGGGGEAFDTMLAPKKDGKNTSAADKEAKAREWTVAIVQAANSARKAGKLPGSIERMVDQLLDGKADWRTLLKRFITERTRDGFSWQRFNRRMQALGIFLPGRYSEQMETLVVVADDSGSIGHKVLNAFAAETNAARDAATPANTILISCDARVNHVATFEAGEPLVIRNRGGGGTDFRPPFRWLEQQGITPSCLVYLTDLEGSFPDAPPDYPVLWCSINNRTAPWGETIKVEV